jgi:hypothetical protein
MTTTFIEICDSCGKQVEDYKGKLSVKNIKIKFPAIYKEYDLCDECIDKILNIIKIKK